MPRAMNLPISAAARKQSVAKNLRTRIEFAIWQAEHIGWPALAASFKRDLAALEAGRLTKWGTT